MQGVCPKCGGLLLPGEGSCLICRKVKIDADESPPTKVENRTAGTSQPPNLAEGSGQVTKPQRGGIFGLIRAATSVMSCGRCPKCHANFAAESDGEEALGTTYRLLGENPEGDLFGEEPEFERTTTKAKKSRCRKCGHRWHEEHAETKMLRGACPTCHERSAIESKGEDVLKTDFVVVGGGPGKNYFQGRSEVRVHVEYLKKFHCKKCAVGWRHKASRDWTANGVCPVCYSDRKEPILREKVRSHDTRQTKKQSDVIINRNYDPVGQTIRQELVVIREDWWEATFRCRSCLHEWKELSSESYRVF